MKIIPLIIIFPLLAGCNSLLGNKPATTLETTLSAYRTAIRWGYWSQVFNFYTANTIQPTIVLDNIRVTAYEVLQPPIFINEQHAIQVVEIQYVLNDKQILHKILDKQDWHYNNDTELWQLHHPLPKFL